jgi:hypothetical protein
MGGTIDDVPASSLHIDLAKRELGAQEAIIRYRAVVVKLLSAT